MGTFIDLFKLLYPFLQEFGLREVNFKQFIANNKTMCYMFLMCVILFLLFIYALEQAHLRMLYNQELLIDQKAIIVKVDACIKNSEQLRLLCLADTENNSYDDRSIEELLGQTHEQ